MKKFPQSTLFLFTLIWKLHTFPLPIVLLLLSAFKRSSLHAFSCKQEAKSLCAYWEEVTSLPCRKYNYSIIRSSRCLIGLVCPDSSFFLSNRRVSSDTSMKPTDVPNITKSCKVIRGNSLCQKKSFLCPVESLGAGKRALGIRIPKTWGSSVPLRVCSPGVTRRPQVHCGCSMEERFVFKPFDQSLNSAKKGRVATMIKIKRHKGAVVPY